MNNNMLSLLVLMFLLAATFCALTVDYYNQYDKATDLLEKTSLIIDKYEVKVNELESDISKLNQEIIELKYPLTTNTNNEGYIYDYYLYNGYKIVKNIFTPIPKSSEYAHFWFEYVWCEPERFIESVHNGKGYPVTIRHENEYSYERFGAFGEDKYHEFGRTDWLETSLKTTLGKTK